VSWPGRALVAGLVALVPWLQGRVDDVLGRYREQEAVLYLWSGGQVKRLAPGFESLMADLYWLRTVQYFGGQRVFAREKRFDLLEPLIDITVTLDPRLEIAYRYGATFLSEPLPRGAGRPEAGVALLERGTRALPNSWLIHQTLGFFIYFYLGDAPRAAEALLAARQLPGAPAWLENLAAAFLATGGRRSVAREIWTRLYEQESGVMRINAEGQLQRLDALDAVDRLRAAVARFHERHARLPASFEELARDRLLPFPPVDPSGTPYVYSPGSGRVYISRHSPLWRAPGLLATEADQ